MTTIRISDATFANLKSISTWMGDEKPSETIDNLVREKMGKIDIVDESDAAAETTENDDVLSRRLLCLMRWLSRYWYLCRLCILLF